MHRPKLGGTVIALMLAAGPAASADDSDPAFTINLHHQLIVDCLQILDFHMKELINDRFDATEDALDSLAAQLADANDEIQQNLSALLLTLQFAKQDLEDAIDEVRLTLDQTTNLVITQHAELLARADAQDAKLLELEAQLAEILGAVQAADDENLRMQAEHNLALADDDPRRRRIIYFQTPAVAGGQLEMVRQIVAECFQMHVAAGLTPHPFASQQMNQGDSEYAAQNYRAAYDCYRKAYRSLAL